LKLRLQVSHSGLWERQKGGHRCAFRIPRLA
jgi:hypothetical protein